MMNDNPFSEYGDSLESTRSEDFDTVVDVGDLVSSQKY